MNKQVITTGIIILLLGFLFSSLIVIIEMKGRISRLENIPEVIIRDTVFLKGKPVLADPKIKEVLTAIHVPVTDKAALDSVRLEYENAVDFYQNIVDLLDREVRHKDSIIDNYTLLLSSRAYYDSLSAELYSFRYNIVTGGPLHSFDYQIDVKKVTETVEKKVPVKVFPEWTFSPVLGLTFDGSPRASFGAMVGKDNLKGGFFYTPAAGGRRDILSIYTGFYMPLNYKMK